MIYSIQGKIILKKDKFIVLESAGIGFKIFLSQKTFSNIEDNKQTIKVFCFLDVKETSLNLYGFLDYKELEFFEILNSIRGIGPKVALEISSLGPLEKIKERILANDEKLFEGIPGIGRKRAGAIILELSGKVKNLFKKEKLSETDEAEEALVNLGFSRQRVKQALKHIPKDIKSSEEKIKEALKGLDISF